LAIVSTLTYIISLFFWHWSREYVRDHAKDTEVSAEMGEYGYENQELHNEEEGEDEVEENEEEGEDERDENDMDN